MVFSTFILAGLFFSCQKSESVDSEYESAAMTIDSTGSVQNDEVSYAASQQMEGQKFQKLQKSAWK